MISAAALGTTLAYLAPAGLGLWLFNHFDKKKVEEKEEERP